MQKNLVTHYFAAYSTSKNDVIGDLSKNRLFSDNNDMYVNSCLAIVEIMCAYEFSNFLQKSSVRTS